MIHLLGGRSVLEIEGFFSLSLIKGERGLRGGSFEYPRRESEVTLSLLLNRAVWVLQACSLAIRNDLLSSKRF